MNFVSLFSGIGGFDLALERAGMTPVAQVEIDKHARSVLARHWPAVPRFEDVRTFTRESIDGPVDVVCGGFPCQDLSVAGRRAGLAGERSGLWHEFRRILEEFGPEWCVIENVPGLLSSHGGRDFALLLQGLAQLRYRIAWRVLDARYFGVPQRRRRVVIVGHIGDGRAAQVLFEPESVLGHPAPRRQAQQAAPREVETGPGTAGWRFQRTDRYVADDEASALTARDYKSARDLVESYRPVKHDQFAADEESHSLRARQPRDTDQIIAFGHQLAGSARTDIVRQGDHAQIGAQTQDAIFHENIGSHVTLDDTAKALRAGASKSYQGVVGIRAANTSSNGWGISDEESHTLDQSTPHSILVPGENPRTAQPEEPMALSENQRAENRLTEYSRQLTTGGGKPGQGYPTILTDTLRRLTPLECERLQGFPDHWTAGQSDSHRYKQTGNAVAVPVFEWVARRIMENR